MHNVILKNTLKKISELLGILKLLPTKIYVIAFLAMIFAFVVVGSEYTLALLLQVYLCLLGFVSADKIVVFLRPLTTNIFLSFIILIATIFLRGVCVFVLTYVNIAFGETFVYETRKHLLYSLFRPNSRWHYDLGTTSNIMGEIIPKGASFISSFAQFLTLLLQTAGLSILCFISLPREFLISLLLFGVMGPFVIYLNRKSRRYGYDILERSKKMNVQLMKSVKNFVFIKILGMEEIERDKTLDLAKDYYSYYMNNIRYYSMANAVPGAFGMIVVMLLFYLFNIGGTSKASLLTMFYLLLRFIQTLSSTVALTNGLTIYYPNFRSTIDIMRRNQEEENKEKQYIASPIFKETAMVELPDDLTLTVKDLAFSYNTMLNEKFIFNKVTFTLHPGELFVVKGPSGSGKSTFLMNLIGVLSPSSGYIRWGNIELSKLNPRTFKQRVGYMGPEPYIISGTVYKNLCYGLHKEPTEEELIRACKLAEVYDFLKQMPNGFDTMLTEQGEGLSMGQKQRLGLARALLRQPKILVLDEITANLDLNTETTVINNIKKLKADMIILIATHSAAFDQIADVVVDFNNNSKSCV